MNGIKNISKDFGIEYVERDKKFRSGFGIERRKGWAVYNRHSAKDVRTGFASETEAIEYALAEQARKDRPAESPAAPAQAAVASAEASAAHQAPAADSGFQVRKVVRRRSGGKDVHYRNGAVEYHIPGMSQPMQIWDEA